MTSPKELKGRCLLQGGREQLEAPARVQSRGRKQQTEPDRGGQRVRGREAIEEKGERAKRRGPRAQSVWPRWQGSIGIRSWVGKSMNWRQLE